MALTFDLAYLSLNIGVVAEDVLDHLLNMSVGTVMLFQDGVRVRCQISSLVECGLQGLDVVT